MNAATQPSRQLRSDAGQKGEGPPIASPSRFGARVTLRKALGMAQSRHFGFTSNGARMKAQASEGLPRYWCEG
jgi:hypothetical protein